MFVEPEPECLASRVAQREKARLRCAGSAPGGCDVLHRALKLGFGDVGAVGRDFLVRPVFDGVAGELLPIARPVAAEPAIAVIDQDRAWTRSRRLCRKCWLVCGCLLHVQRRGLLPKSPSTEGDPGPVWRLWQIPSPLVGEVPERLQPRGG